MPTPPTNDFSPTTSPPAPTDAEAASVGRARVALHQAVTMMDADARRRLLDEENPPAPKTAWCLAERVVVSLPILAEAPPSPSEVHRVVAVSMTGTAVRLDRPEPFPTVTEAARAFQTAARAYARPGFIAHWLVRAGREALGPGIGTSASEREALSWFLPECYALIEALSGPDSAPIPKRLGGQLSMLQVHASKIGEGLFARDCRKAVAMALWTHDWLSHARDQEDE